MLEKISICLIWLINVVVVVVVFYLSETVQMEKCQLFSIYFFFT